MSCSIFINDFYLKEKIICARFL